MRAADRQGRLEPDDLDWMARSAYLIGALDAAVESWERAHHAFRERGDVAPAVRCAFWIGLALVLHGEQARGGGWLARARHLLDDAALDCAEQGYLLARPSRTRRTSCNRGHAVTAVVVRAAQRWRSQSAATTERLDRGPDIHASRQLLEWCWAPPPRAARAASSGRVDLGRRADARPRGPRAT